MEQGTRRTTIQKRTTMKSPTTMTTTMKSPTTMTTTMTMTMKSPTTMTMMKSLTTMKSPTTMKSQTTMKSRTTAKSRCTWTERVPMLRPQRLTLTRLVLPWPAGWNFERLSMIRHLFTATGKVTRASFSSHPKGTLKTYALEVIIKGPDGNHGLQRGEEGKGVIKS